ncbi:MAG TPA: type II toxin-antitoxin system VapC family toxin [Thermoguttaceae bacterium]|nr:type II toxin-antitoxin system VapC family toxin [Thermoguttaceae bacterium]
MPAREEAVVFLLDTDHIAIIQRQTEPEFGRLAARMQQYPLTDFYVPIVSFHEQVAGWNAYINRATTLEAVVKAYRMYERILADFACMQVLPFDAAAGRTFESLRKQRVRIGTMDLRIAATALTRGFKLLSRNLIDFRKVPGLAVEDWTAAQHE